MLLKSGHSTHGAEHNNICPSQIITPNHTNNSIVNTSIANLTTVSTLSTATTTSINSLHSNNISQDITRYLDLIQDTLKEGWTVHTTKDGRLYYCNHITRTAGWLPPAENWGHNIEFPYGWEKAIDSKSRSYYINHLNKATTYEAPEIYRYDDKPPEPRLVVLTRSSAMGFGFVAGSERPVIVRFVTEGGPSVNKLEPGDRILAVNNEDVKEAPRDHVIQLVRSCDTQVSLLVCQPSMSGCSGRKSTLLSAGKKAKLRTRPNRVRFAESVCVNGTPLFPPSAFSLGDICVPQMANVLKVFLENGQTKSFKYDSTTTVQDVVTSLRDKLCLNAEEHFSLVLEHVKSLKRNKLTLLDPKETLARIAARPGAHKLRCLFRVTFVPVSAAILAQKDLNALDYLYMQCCNDVTQERFSPELQADVALRLAALNIHQHSLANNISPAKLTVKTVEREFGLERFVPSSLIESMKRKELRRLMAHFLKLNSQMTGSSSKMLTQLQAKIHYLDIISGLPSYGAKCFSTNQRDGIERVLLISPRFGLSQIAGVRNSVPQPICNIEDLTRVAITREDDITHSVTVYIQLDRFVTFSMEDRDACEFSLVLSGYYRLLAGGGDLPIDKEEEEYIEENAPPYLSQHTVFPASWNYLPTYQGHMHSMAFYTPPPYHSVSHIPINEESGIGSDIDTEQNHCDRNMNSTLSNNNHKSVALLQNGICTQQQLQQQHQQHNQHTKTTTANDPYGYDIHSMMTMEILEGTKAIKPMNGLIETRNEEVLRRVAEMQRMVESSEKYLNEQGELVHEFEMKPDTKLPWKDTSLDFDSDCESMTSSKQSSNEDAPAPGALKHSDSLVLLAESINLDLTGLGNTASAVSLINAAASNNGYSSNDTISSAALLQNHNDIGTKVQRRAHGLSQLLSDLHALSNDLSQSESDSESVCTPNQSPIHRNLPTVRNSQTNFRSSFGLHSPDNSVLGPESKDTNLKEYLRQLKEASNKEQTQDIDFAAEKLTELYGFEIGGDTFIETDPDVIDLTTIPPPQTPDELDALNVIDAAPRGFGDLSQKYDITSSSHTDLEKFLAKVIIAPPTQKVTPAKELTPEEIMSFIIPPPPGLEDNKLAKLSIAPTNNIMAKCGNNDTSTVYCAAAPVVTAAAAAHAETEPIVPKSINYPDESLYINSTIQLSNETALRNELKSKTPENHVIEYATVERKGPFSCCTKSKKTTTSTKESGTDSDSDTFRLPPRRCEHTNNHIPPERPPKSDEVKMLSPTGNGENRPFVRFNNSSDEVRCMNPPKLPPRPDFCNTTSMSALPPRKPHLPPVPNKPIFRTPVPLPKPSQITDDLSPSPSIRLAGIGSPHLNRHPNTYNAIDGAFTSSSNNTNPFDVPPIPAARTNGHYRSHSDCPPVCLKNPPANAKPQLSLLCSPQMSRKLSTPSATTMSNSNGFNVTQPPGKMYVNVESLLAKTDVAMAGLLVKLDQIAAQCSAAQAAGGGVLIDEQKFQLARDELTDHALQLVTASKLLVVTMSQASVEKLPEHLTSCLTALRRITELAHDMTRHTLAPLQTRNIVLKIHDVASSFRELVGVPVGLCGAGPLALQAECLANVLATLLRSLRVFSP